MGKDKQKTTKLQSAQAVKYILCSGGIGDALIGAAESYKFNKATVIFGTNRNNTQFIREVFEVCEVPYIIFPDSFAENLKPLFNKLCIAPECLSICHLPVNMDYRNEWWKADKYAAKIPRELPVRELFGCTIRGRKKKIAISPIGSNLPPIRIPTKLGYKTKIRAIARQELLKLATLYAFTHDVYIVGSPDDQLAYGPINHAHCFWINNNYIEDSRGNRTKINLRKLFAILNSCERIISVDSWVKTYGYYAKVDTTVIKTKYDNQYFNEVIDPSDNIFLNPKVWDFTIKTIEELCEQ